MRDYGMDYQRGRSGWMGGTDRGYDTGYGRGHRGWNDRGSAFQGRGEYDSYSRRDYLTNQGDFSDDFGGGRDYGYQGMNRGGMDRGSAFRERGGMSRDYGHDYGRDYSGMDRGGREHEGGGRFFQHWVDDDVDGWESGRHGMPGTMGRGMGRGGNERWLDDNGYPRGYQGRGIHNYGGGGRDYFRAYGASFPIGYDPRW